MDPFPGWGNDPDYPARRLRGQLAGVRSKLTAMDTDPLTPDTRTPESCNPVSAENLIELTMGGMGNGFASRIPTHCHLRYFDRDRRRPGLTEDVGALVDTVDDSSVSVTLVNVGPTRAHALVVQGGNYGEHRLLAYQGDDQTSRPVGDSAVDVWLGPGAGARLTLRLERYSRPPRLSFPW